MTLPQIPQPSCCGSSASAVGWTPCPTDQSHNHDDKYPRRSEVDCSDNAGRGEIIGTPDPSICTDCDTVAGYAYSVDSEASPVLSIVGWTEGGVGPFATPKVQSITVSDEKVTVTWGPDDNNATIGLATIAAAIAADAQAAALMRIAVCDCDAFSAFNVDDIPLAVPILLIPDLQVTDPNGNVDAPESTVGVATNGDYWMKVVGSDNQGWRKVIIANENGEIVGPLIPRTGTIAELEDVVLADGELAIISDRGVPVYGFDPASAKLGLTVIGNGVDSVDDLPWYGHDVIYVEDDRTANLDIMSYSNAEKVSLIIYNIKAAGLHGGNISSYGFASYKVRATYPQGVFENALYLSFEQEILVFADKKDAEPAADPFLMFAAATVGATLAADDVYQFIATDLLSSNPTPVNIETKIR